MHDYNDVKIQHSSNLKKIVEIIWQHVFFTSGENLSKDGVSHVVSNNVRLFDADL
jgi:hypothetical protein